MSTNDAADAAVDTWIASMSPASAEPTAVRDAMRPLARAIFAGIGNRATATHAADTTIGIAAYATLLTANIATLQASGYIDIFFTASGAHITNPATTFFQITVDGTPLKGTQATASTGFGWSVAFSGRVAVSAGAHTVLVQWKTDNASARINAASVVEEHAHLHVEEAF